MGSSASKSYYIKKEWEKAEKRASEIYNYRINNYNPVEHGTPTNYMQRIKSEYELECIPEYLRSEKEGNKLNKR